MSTGNEPGEGRPGPGFGDWAALSLQRLRSHDPARAARPLLRIDNRAEAMSAPFQFDVVGGTLHRTGCRAIPASARTALYALWRIGPEEQQRACPWCRPVPSEQHQDVPAERAALLFGLVSVIDQFAGVLKERGRDFQRSPGGQQLSAQLDQLYRTLGQREKALLDTVLTTLDQLVERLRKVDEELGRDPDGRGKGGDGRGGADG